MEPVSSPQPQRLFVNDTLSLKLHKVSIVGTKDLIKRVKITPPPFLEGRKSNENC